MHLTRKTIRRIHLMRPSVESCWRLPITFVDWSWPSVGSGTGVEGRAARYEVDQSQLASRHLAPYATAQTKPIPHSFPSKVLLWPALCCHFLTIQPRAILVLFSNCFLKAISFTCDKLDAFSVQKTIWSLAHLLSVGKPNRVAVHFSSFFSGASSDS